MGKFGKKNIISTNPLDYSICLCGIGGIGKTTLGIQMCEKLVGTDGYIHFNIGKESGVNALNNAVTEPIEDWEKLEEVVDDIIENKQSDYPDLRVIIWDSLDELLLIGENETIRQYNKTVTSDKKAATINGAWGGFGKALDRNVNMILDVMWNLKKVGVQSFIIAHTKRSDIIDPITQATYSQLTADAQQRYFNAVKNKMDIVAVGYIDREIVTENLGRKNIVTKKEETTNRVKEEVRVISFRDDENFAVDSKSRFAEIVPKIPFDTDAFIKAIEDAIASQMKAGGISEKDAKAAQKKREEERAEIATEYSKNQRENKIDGELNEEIVGEIKTLFDEVDNDKKKSVKEIMAENGLKNFKDVSDVPTRVLQSILDALKA